MYHPQMAPKIPSSFPLSLSLLTSYCVLCFSIPVYCPSHHYSDPPSFLHPLHVVSPPHSCSSISLTLSFLYLFSSIVLYFLPIPFSCLSYLLHYPHTLAVSGVPRGGLGCSNPPEIPKALQNHAKLNPIVNAVKNC